MDDVTTAFHRSLFVMACRSMSCLRQHLIEQQKQTFESTLRSVKVFRGQLERDNKFYSFDPPGDEVGTPKTDGVLCCVWCATWRAEKRCSGCHDSHYCSREHQVEHWRAGHAEYCKAIQTGKTAPSTEKLPEREDSESLCPDLVEGPLLPGGTGDAPGDEEIAVEKVSIPGVLVGSNPRLWPEFELVVEEEDEEEDEEADEGDERKPEDDIHPSGDERTQSLLQQYKQRTMEEGEYESEELQGIVEEASAEKKQWVEFQSRLSKNPQQVLRHCRSEQARPLWPRLQGKLEKVAIPPCNTCGAQRIFEFQVLPQLLYYLKVDSTNDDSLDFGTIAVYVCSDSCSPKSGPGGYLEEFAFVQSGPE